VVALTEALIILNLNTIPSLGILLCFLQREKASINADIGEELLSYFCDWLKSATDMTRTCKLDFKTPQTLKSGAKTLSRPSQETDSDGDSDDDQRVPPISAREKINQIMAARRGATTKQNDETDEYVLRRLVSQGSKLKDEHIDALAMCHAGRDEMIRMQRAAADIIRK
jgi:hypothetical protein